MSMTKKRFALIAMTAAMALLLCGCPADSASNAPLNIAVVSGYRANNPMPPFKSDTVFDNILRCTTSFGSAVLIIADGQPYAAADYSIKPPSKNISDSKRRDIADAQARQIVEALLNAPAVSEEADTLEAITLAARGLSEKTGDKLLLVLDSGLSTAGYCDFTKNYLRVADSNVVDYLTQMQAIPNLADVDVLWIGLGDVSGTQNKLTPANKETLKDIWNGVLLAAGAKSVTFSDALPGTAPEVELPRVTPVVIYNDAALWIDDQVDFAEYLDEQPIVFDETKLLFLPDSPELADPNAAMEALSPIATMLLEHPDFHIVLVGTTATAGTQEGCNQLSMARAAAVKSLLLEAGASEAQIEAVYGLGYDNIFHIPDLNADGSQNENAAANRSVIVLGADAPLASQLKGE